MKKRLLVAMVAALLAATGALPAGAGSQETTDVLNQGGAGVYSDGATLNRTPNGLRMTVTVPNASTGHVRLSGWCRGRPSGGIHVVGIRVQSAGPMRR